jgi:SpoIVB peptidase S55
MKLKFLLAAALLGAPTIGFAGPDRFWNVDDVRPGMKGQGRTVMKGTKIETFDAEVMGVLRNTSPGRDMVLCMLSGLGLENTGVIQGMSGSPVYIDGKLLGAVAYAWQFGKLPIAGVTPFVQMREFADLEETKERPAAPIPVRIGLSASLKIDGKEIDAVTIGNFADASPTAADGLWLQPLRTPVCTSGFSPRSLDLLRDSFRGTGLVPMQGGAIGGKTLTDEERNTRIEPGSALAVSLVSGDFDMSGIGTVTHVDGKRVYGWGHPFLGIGACDFPLMTGYTHAILPRVSISFKMGSPLRMVGAIHSDVSTCIAGTLDRPVDLLPMRTTVKRPGGPARTFNVQLVRQKQMLPGLVSAVLANSVDMEGDLPEEMTARLKVAVHVEGHAPITFDDFHSGPNLVGARGVQALYGQAAMVTSLLSSSSLGKIRIEKIDCETDVIAGRRTAEIESVEPSSEVYAPGETVKARVVIHPYKGARTPITVSLPLPADLPEGSYTANVGDGFSNLRQELRDNPHLGTPTTLAHLFKAVEAVASGRRTELVLRVATQDGGVAIGDHDLPDLPASMVQILGSGRKTGAMPIASALVGRAETEWVLQGSDSFRFTVARNKRVSD